MFNVGDRVKITIPFWKRLAGSIAMHRWLPKYGTYKHERSDMAAYEILDDDGNMWFIAWGYLELLK